MAQKAEELSDEQLEAEVEGLAMRLERLRILYDQYFIGIEKRPPHTLRKDVVRIINRLSTARIRSTAMKFRFQGLMQKFNSQKSYWNRTEREIEEGRYHRHLNRIQRREAAAGEEGGTRVREYSGDFEPIEDEGPSTRTGASTEEGAAAEEFLRTMMGEIGATRATVQEPSAPTPSPTPATASAGASAGTGDGGPRGIDADELARRAEKLRQLRERLVGGASAAGAAARPATPAPSAAAPVGAGPTPAPATRPAPATPAPPRPAAPAAAAAATPRPAPAAPRPAPAPARPAPDPVREVFERLVATKRQLNEPTDKLSLDSFRSTLQQQRDAVRQKQNCRDVDFDVVVKEGRAYLKPIPKF